MFLKSLLVAGAIAASTAGVATPAIADSGDTESGSGWHLVKSWQEEKAWEKCQEERKKWAWVYSKCAYEAPKVNLYVSYGP